LFPGDEVMRARVERFIESASQDRDWNSSEAVASASAVDVGQDDEQPEEQGMDVEIVRMMPRRKPAEEPEAEPVPRVAERSAPGLPDYTEMGSQLLKTPGRVIGQFMGRVER
jgi:hypothetical protein